MPSKVSRCHFSLPESSLLDEQDPESLSGTPPELRRGGDVTESPFTTAPRPDAFTPSGAGRITTGAGSPRPSSLRSPSVTKTGPWECV